MKKKILFFTTTLKKGGAEKQLIQFIDGINNLEKFEIRVISLFGGDYEKDLKSFGISYKVFSKSSFNNLFKFILMFRKEVKSFKPNIVHSFLFSSNIVSKLSLFFMKKSFKLICSYRGILQNYNSIKYLEILNNKKVDLFISNSNIANESLDFFNGIEESKKIVIENGFLEKKLDVKKVNYLKQKYKNKKIVLTVGAFRFEKNYKTNLLVCKEILEKKEDVLFLYVGEDGPEKRMVEDFKKNNALSNLNILGRRADVLELMSISDVLFLPTLFESQPNVILEAMYYNLPIVSSKVEGILNLKSKSILCEPNDVECMSKSILSIIENNFDKSSLKYNKDIIIKNYSNDVMIKKYYKEYLKLVN
ncbi:MAG: glycosyltransferase [Nanoarchaeota archaeon]|nr:glycosyltransferase [Nanoarchaeota archaeon]